MADVNVNSITGDGGSLPRLAPDLSYPENLVIGVNYTRISGLDPTVGLITALSLTGKHSVEKLAFTLSQEPITIKLTVDGIVIWNSSFSAPANFLHLIGYVNSYTAPFQCESSLLLEIQTTADSTVTLDYLARPIL